jgi:hypothetical protein
MKTTILIVSVVVCAVGLAGLAWYRATHRSPRRFSAAQFERHAQAKEAALERILGPMNDLVGHAPIPFQGGGNVDMYYFTSGIPGTAFATMELIEPDGSGPRPNRVGTYELVAFTRLTGIVRAYDLLPRGQQSPSNPPSRSKEEIPFVTIERRMCRILTAVGRFAHGAVLNPGDTCELPMGAGAPNACLIFDEYSPAGIPFEIDGQRHGLLLCLEVFRSEMEYAMKNGSASVLKGLKEKGFYPYSDLDRPPIY